MNHSEQTIQQADRAIEKIIAKFPASSELISFTDIHIRLNQDTGDLFAYDDDDNEITRCVVTDWINCTSETFYADAATLLRQRLNMRHDQVCDMCISKPFSWVLEDEEHETIAELFLADDETIIIGGDLMDNLNQDLDAFLEELMKD